MSIPILFHDPFLFFACLLTCGVIVVNGWTDAPNAIATCIATRALSPRIAIGMSAACNLLGVVCMTSLNASVADTVLRMADFGNDPVSAAIALCAAMIAIVIWAIAAWVFGIPTSESHALIAGLSGAAVALTDSMHSLRGAEWRKILLGLLLSTLLGFLLGFLCTRITAHVFRRTRRLRTVRFFKSAEIFGAAAMSFMHGAQDGQKFIGVFLLLGTLGGMRDVTTPFWLLILCSALMALGTSIGGLRIIKAVGMDMVRLKPYQGFSADLGSTVCLLLCSLTGIPVSTTHTKTSAVMGAGAALRRSAINLIVVRDMVLTWVLTFPACGFIGWTLTKVFLVCT